MNRFILRLTRVVIVALLVAAQGAAQTAAPLSAEAVALQKQGLTNVGALDSTLIVRLMYASNNNFVGENMYGALREAFLQPEAARKLALAQKYLREANPRYRLIVYDAARPQLAQVKMWNKVKNTHKRRYVSSPATVSMHTYGVAVDVSIADGAGREIDMGTPVDFLGALAEPRHEAQYLAEGKLTQAQINNRALLRRVMKKAGFRGISNEWWHFEACTRAEAKQTYRAVE
jgi:D-alanyl-D-alanine dipeptidase